MNSDTHEDDQSRPNTVAAVLEGAKDIGHVDVSDYKFLEYENVMGGNYRFVLSDAVDNSPLFFMQGRVQSLNTTPSAVVAARRLNRDVFVDEYSTCIEPESNIYRERMRENLNKFLIALCTTSNIWKIAFEAGTIHHINEPAYGYRLTGDALYGPDNG